VFVLVVARGVGLDESILGCFFGRTDWLRGVAHANRAA
jgi:hypothetical protein